MVLPYVTVFYIFNSSSTRLSLQSFNSFGYFILHLDISSFLSWPCLGPVLYSIPIFPVILFRCTSSSGPCLNLLQEWTRVDTPSLYFFYFFYPSILDWETENQRDKKEQKKKKKKKRKTGDPDCSHPPLRLRIIVTFPSLPTDRDSLELLLCSILPCFFFYILSLFIFVDYSLPLLSGPVSAVASPWPILACRCISL